MIICIQRFHKLNQPLSNSNVPLHFNPLKIGLLDLKISPFALKCVFAHLIHSNYILLLLNNSWTTIQLYRALFLSNMHLNPQSTQVRSYGTQMCLCISIHSKHIFLTLNEYCFHRCLCTLNALKFYPLELK